MSKDEMYNFEDIVRKLVESNIRKIINSKEITWCLTYGEHKFSKPIIHGEHYINVVDWFYQAVLQYEKDKGKD